MQVARELGVEAVLIGTVSHRGNNLIVQVDLLNGENGSSLWTKQYEDDFNNLVQVQEDISRKLIQELRLNLTPEQSSRLTKRYASNSAAYQHYLMGRYYWNKRTPEGLISAAEQFQAAKDKDRNYALAYSGLADCYLLLEEYAGTPISETLPKARAAAQRAVDIDDSLAEAHTSLAKARQHSWEWPSAETEYRRAIGLNPKYPTARQWYSGLLIDRGRLDEALMQIKAAQELDPVSPIIIGNVGYTYFLKGDLAAAQSEYNKLIEQDPTFPVGHAVLGLLYLKQARSEEAIAELQKAVKFSGRSGHALSALGYAYAVSGKHKEARLIIQELETKYQQKKTSATNLAGVFAGLEEKDQAFTWLEKDFQARSYELTRLASEPLFDTLRSDPRYANLLQRMGLAR